MTQLTSRTQQKAVTTDKLILLLRTSAHELRAIYRRWTRDILLVCDLRDMILYIREFIAALARCVAMTSLRGIYR